MAVDEDESSISDEKERRKTDKTGADLPLRGLGSAFRVGMSELLAEMEETSVRHS